MDRYVDPNSGAAPQPGGFAVAPASESKTEEEAAQEGLVPAETLEDATTEEEPTEEDATTEESDEYDPADHTVDEVVEYVSSHPDEKAAIVKKEEAGKNRSTLLSQLED